MNALILDTETHDLDGLPIEIAHVPFYFYQDAPHVEGSMLFDEYFSIDQPISHAAMAVHHILESDLASNFILLSSLLRAEIKLFATLKRI